MRLLLGQIEAWAGFLGRPRKLSIEAIEVGRLALLFVRFDVIFIDVASLSPASHRDRRVKASSSLSISIGGSLARVHFARELFIMRKIAALLFTFFLLVLCHTVPAQTRARRVGQDQPPTAPSASRSQPPVLKGATKPGDERSATQPAAPATGQQEVDENDVIRVDTTLVTIPVSVMDRQGKYIPNLHKEDFHLWEDGVEQTIGFFQSVDKPFSVVLMIDVSGSTRFRLEEIQDAAIAFVNQLQNDDRVMVISFDDRVRILSDFTSDRHQLRQAIQQTRPGSGTALYDAVDVVINQKLDQLQGRKAIVLFTDGVDTTSKHASYESTLRDAEELDALIYPVQFDTSADTGGGSYPRRRGRNPQSGTDILGDILGGVFGRNGGGGNNGGGQGGGGGRRGGGGWPGGGRGGGNGAPGDYDQADRYLHELADRTGARLFEADSTQNLSSAFANVAEELRRQYSIGYYPKRPPQVGQRRQIKVRVNQPDLAVRARDSYVFNPQANSSAQTTPPPSSAPVLKKKLAQSTVPAGRFAGL